MGRQSGHTNLVRWQSRRGRRAKGASPAGILVLAVCGLVGGAAVAAQAFGGLHLQGPAAAAPAALVVLALGVHAVGLARAAFAWLAG